MEKRDEHGYLKSAFNTFIRIKDFYFLYCLNIKKRAINKVYDTYKHNRKEYTTTAIINGKRQINYI